MKTCSIYWDIILFVVLFWTISEVTTKFEFTNLKCITQDAEFLDFDHCYLKSVNRSYKYLSIRGKLKILPVTNIMLNFALLKRLNGYKPFLYNVTFDACEFLKKPKNSLVIFFYSIFAAYSNLNHTCPYDHDLIVEKLPFDAPNYKLTKILPMPEGDYCVETSWYSSGIKRADVMLYFKIS